MDIATGLAIIDLNTNDRLPAVPIGDSDRTSLGDSVVALGYQIGGVLGQSPTITRGIISSRRVLDGVDYLQTDAAVYPGNVGGPLIDRSGKVVGVNSNRYEEVGGRPIEGVALAIAIKEVMAKLPVLPLAASLDTPRSLASPTPVVPSLSDTSEVVQSGKYGFSIRVAPGWTRETATDPDDPFSFRAPGNVGLVRVAVHDMAGFTSLTAFAEWRRDGTQGSSIDLEQEGGREFYRLVRPDWRLDQGCPAFYMELITISSSYPDKPHGFVVSSAVCDDSINAYDQDRLDMLDSFIEWEHYRNKTHGFSINVAPEWTLSEEGSGHVSIWAPYGRGLLELSVFDLGDFASYPAFAEWRRSSVRADGESSVDFKVLKSEKLQEAGREFYRFQYVKQESEEVCVARHFNIIGRFSKGTHGFIIHSAFCEYSRDIYSKDISDMLASFTY